MSEPSREILIAYETANIEDAKQIPYVYGGGHTKFGPTFGIYNKTIVGFDCSGWVSYILDKAGILYSNVPLATEELENWGLSGRGEFMTLWVRNFQEEHHCFLDFAIPGKIHKWSQAGHAGELCGWANELLTAGFVPRRRK